MGHVSHVFVPRPWAADLLGVDSQERRHLDRVLRLEPGAAISYTDGAGVIGDGYYADGTIRRGEERETPPSRAVTVAVAPPRQVDRSRFVVEKLGELGVERLVWLESVFGEGKPPRKAKATAWAVAALQQSRGAHLLQIEEPITLSALAEARPEAILLVAEPGAGSIEQALSAVDGEIVVCVGPEGGFRPDELPAGVRKIGLGPRILRTETAAVVAGGLILQGLGVDD